MVPFYLMQPTVVIKRARSQSSGAICMAVARGICRGR